LLKSLRRSPVPTYGFFALTRFGARKLFYGPLNAVVHPEIVQQWLDAVLPFEPGHQSERVAWLFCLAQLARRSGQRALDVDDSHRASVLAVVRGPGAPGRLIPAGGERVEGGGGGSGRAGGRGAERTVRRIAADRATAAARGGREVAGTCSHAAVPPGMNERSHRRDNLPSNPTEAGLAARLPSRRRDSV